MWRRRRAEKLNSTNNDNAAEPVPPGGPTRPDHAVIYLTQTSGPPQVPAFVPPPQVPSSVPPPQVPSQGPRPNAAPNYQGFM